jgi:DNA-binding MarR family transcriptional regulator
MARQQSTLAPVDAPAGDPIAEARRQWVERWGPAPAPGMTAVASIMRAQQILMSRLNELLKPFDLTFPRYEALMLLYFSRTGALALGRLGRRLQSHPTSVTNTIDGLERVGYVRREAAEEDRRQTLAAITDAGREAAEGATQVVNAARFATAPLTRAALEQISDVLRDLRAAADAES